MPKKRLKKYKIIVVNDSINTFEHVQRVLQEICGHNHYQSIQCTQIIHNNGQCQVYMSKEDQCTYILKELKKQNISAKMIK
jgi:ATP-dependent Clp protease adaptor protein ClpS